jgi:hypothetical protein
MPQLFCIYRQTPIYNRFADHLEGALIRPLPMAYCTQALAAKLADLLDQRSAGGDAVHWAGPVGDATWQARFGVEMFYSEDIDQ